MKQKKVFLLLALFFTYSFHGFSQASIHYYGWDASLSHYPTDIIQTQDGGFLLTGDVSLSDSLIENYVSRNYLVHTDSTGDTLWTHYYFHDSYGNENIIQTPSGGFISLGQTSGGYLCGIIGTGVPFTDYCVQRFSPIGDSLTTDQYNENCYNNIEDYTTNSSGGITSLMLYEDVNANYSYAIKEMDQAGFLTNISLPNNYVSDIENAGNGYWMASVNGLTKVSSSGNILWQSAINFTPDISDFCRVNNDSLVFLRCYRTGPPPDTVNIMKTDSSGNTGWVKTYHLKAADVMLHSSGNYIVTGRVGNDLAVLALNSNGDSIWGKTYSLSNPAYTVKTIEATGGRIATLGYSGGFGFATQYVLILDSLGSPNGIKENSPAANIDVFPNPATDFIYIRANNTFTSKKIQFELYNGSGAQVKNLPLPGSSSRVPVKEFSSGIYFYNLKQDGKIIKQGKIILDHL